MDKVELPLSLRCPDHRAHVIGMLNVHPNANKIGYCYECIAEDDGDSTLCRTLKFVSNYLDDCSLFYEKCRQRTRNAGEPPADYIEELSKKEERLEKLSKHIAVEKDKVRTSFEEIRKTVIQIIDEKEEECLEVLDKEILGLSEAYLEYEKLLTMGWPKPSDIQSVFPETDALQQRMSQIESMDQLQAFIKETQEDIHIKSS